MPFKAETFQNEYLSEGATEVDAVVTVTAEGMAGLANAAEAVEVIIIDTSGSMDMPSAKIKAARAATTAAVQALRDGVHFAVITGDGEAHTCYPYRGGTARASAASKDEAARAIAGLTASGGTRIGWWLSAADTLFAQHPGAIHHALLLTDGKDEGETAAELDRLINLSKGHFQCDCRGIGTDWQVAELRKVSSALLGTVDIVPDPKDLQAEFEAIMSTSMGRGVGDVLLRLWTPQGAAVRFVKQVSPDIEDLTARRRPGANALTGEYPLGAWGDESRDYHVGLEVKAGAVGDEMLAGRISLIVGPEVVSQSLVKAIWTDDTGLSTRINRHVAHYTGQAELADAIAEGLEARKAGDEATATVRLGRAVQLAADEGNEATTRLLAKVVDVEDAATGTVRLKRQVDDADEMALDTRSTKTVRVRKS